MKRNNNSVLNGQKKSEEILLNYFNKLWREGKPIAKLIETDKSNYIYDRGTNKILICNDVEYYLIKELFNNDVDIAFNNSIKKYGQKKVFTAAKQIIQTIQQENILKSKKATQFGLSSHYKNIEEKMRTELMMLTLEVTDKCNLRCAYCVYVERISLSIVYAPPYSEKKINRITELWVENPWIPENISVQITYPLYHKEIEKILHKERFIEDKNLGQWAIEEFFKNFNL
jgi:hypothetical protein